MSEEFDFERIKNKAIEQLKAGNPFWVRTELLHLYSAEYRIHFKTLDVEGISGVGQSLPEL